MPFNLTLANGKTISGIPDEYKNPESMQKIIARSIATGLDSYEPYADKLGMDILEPELKRSARGIAEKEGLDPDIFERMVLQESTYNPKATSPKGAMGLSQLMPDTAKYVGEKYGIDLSDPYRPFENLRGGAKYLREQLEEFGGDYQLALAAYNAGPGAVKKHGNSIPPYEETQNYVRKILGERQAEQVDKLFEKEKKTPLPVAEPWESGSLQTRKMPKIPYFDNVTGAYRLYKDFGALKDGVVDFLRGTPDAALGAAASLTETLTSAIKATEDLTGKSLLSFMPGRAALGQITPLREMTSQGVEELYQFADKYTDQLFEKPRPYWEDAAVKAGVNIGATLPTLVAAFSGAPLPLTLGLIGTTTGTRDFYDAMEITKGDAVKSGRFAVLNAIPEMIGEWAPMKILTEAIPGLDFGMKNILKYLLVEFPSELGTELTQQLNELVTLEGIDFWSGLEQVKDDLGTTAQDVAVQTLLVGGGQSALGRIAMIPRRRELRKKAEEIRKFYASIATRSPEFAEELAKVTGDTTLLAFDEQVKGLQTRADELAAEFIQEDTIEGRKREIENELNEIDKKLGVLADKGRQYYERVVGKIDGGEKTEIGRLKVEGRKAVFGDFFKESYNPNTSLEQYFLLNFNPSQAVIVHEDKTPAIDPITKTPTKKTPGVYFVTTDYTSADPRLNELDQETKDVINTLENLQKKFLPDETIYFLDWRKLPEKNQTANGWTNHAGKDDVFITSVRTNRPPAEMQNTAAHEFGHIYFASKFKKLPIETQTAIWGDFYRWLKVSSRLNDAQLADLHDGLLRPGSKFPDNWYTRFDEYLANQFTRYVANPKSIKGELGKLFGEWQAAMEVALEDSQHPIIGKRKSKGEPSKALALYFRKGELESELGRLAEQVTPEAAEDVFLATQETGNIGLDRAFAEDVLGGVQSPASFGPLFRSMLREALGKIKQNKATAQQWLAMLKKGQGVKQEEINDIGLEDWLSEREGVVSKEELENFLKQGGVRIEEVVKEETTVKDRLTAMKAYSEELMGMPFNELSDAGRSTLFERYTEKYGQDPKFASYQTPGGKNYRELLITVPTQAAYRAESIPGTKRWRVVGPDGNTVNEYYTQSDAEIAAKSDNRRRRGGYVSSHWNEPNVLVHIRFNERTDVDGKRVLFVEEVHSDWHQEGRKIGYALDPQKAKEKRNELTLQRQQGLITQDEFEEALNETAGPPNAPLKSSWPLLGMKRAIRWAAENGFDRVAWTPGEVQADRYDLSKQVDLISYNTKTNELLAFKDDLTAPILKQTVAANRLDDYIGKEAADKLRNSRVDAAGFQELAGNDLKVGGEGMKGFYDKMLPSMLNKFGKKYGAKVGTTKIKIGEKADLTGPEQDDVLNFNPPIPQYQEVWSIDITPQLQEEATIGLPLYSPAPETPPPPIPFDQISTPEQRRIMKKEMVRLRTLGRRMLTLNQLNWRYNYDGTTLLPPEAQAAPPLAIFADIISGKMNMEKGEFAMLGEGVHNVWNNKIYWSERKAFDNFLHAIDIESSLAGKRITFDYAPDIYRSGKQLLEASGIKNPQQQERVWKVYGEIQKSMDFAIDKLYDMFIANVPKKFPRLDAVTPDQLIEIEEKIAKEKEALEQERKRFKDGNYFPFKRFGDYFTQVIASKDMRYGGRDFKAGQQIIFEQHIQHNQAKKSQGDILNDPQLRGKVNVRIGKLPDNTGSFLMIPQQMWDMIERELLEFSPEIAGSLGYAAGKEVEEGVKKGLETEKAAMKIRFREIRNRLSADNSFRKHLSRKDHVFGWEEDGLRSFAAYFQTLSNYYVRLNNVDALKQQISKMDEMARVEFEGAGQGVDVTPVTEIANYMRSQLNFVMNPGKQYTGLTSFGFYWYLGAVPASVVTQLTQPLMTGGMIAAEYGPALATAHYLKNYKSILSGKLFKASKNMQLEKIDKKMSTQQVVDILSKELNLDSDVVEAIQLGVERQLIDQSFFRELATAAAQNNYSGLSPTMRGKIISPKELMGRFGYIASWGFSQGEKANRLVVFKSVYELERNKLLKAEGKKRLDQLDEEEQEVIKAKARDKAEAMVQLTQGEYRLNMRPELFRGWKAPLLLFQMFPQTMAYLQGRAFWGNKKERMGSLLVLGTYIALAGTAGVIGSDVLWELYLAFMKTQGKGRPDAEKEVRETIVNIFDDLSFANPERATDLLIHGSSRYALAGIPGTGLFNASLDDPILPMDLSQRIGIGNIPVGLAGILESFNAVDAEKAKDIRARTLAQSFPLVSLAVNAADALGQTMEIMNLPTSMDLKLEAMKTDVGFQKAIERAAPAVVGDILKAMRLYFDGASLDYNGRPLLSYDTENPMHLGEIALQGMGFASTAENIEREKNWLIKSYSEYWQARKKSLLDAYWNKQTHGGRDPEFAKKWWADVHEFNLDAPAGARITPENINRSMKDRTRNLMRQNMGLYGGKGYWADQKYLGDLFPE